MNKTFAVAMGIVCLMGGQALAVTQTYTFSTVVTESEGLTGSDPSGTFLGEVGTGSFSYDDSLISGSGSTSLDGSHFDLSFNFLGQSFSGADDVFGEDVSMPGPFLQFQDSAPFSLSFEVEEATGFGNSTAIDKDGVVGFFFDSESLFATGGQGLSDYALGMSVIEGTVDCCTPPAPIPLPATLPLLLGSLGGLAGWSRARRKRAI